MKNVWGINGPRLRLAVTVKTFTEREWKIYRIVEEWNKNAGREVYHPVP